MATNMMVDAWFEYWIEIKRKTVRPNTVRNYTERYHRNIQKVIGKKLLTEVKPLHCQRIFTNMADNHEFICSYYRRRKAKRNQHGGLCLECCIKVHILIYFVALDVALDITIERRNLYKIKH